VAGPDARTALPWALFAASLAVFAVTRLVGLDRFPIYFLADEGIGPVLGVHLFQHGLRDDQGNLLPAYFQNGAYWNLSLSVYLHGLTTTLFGTSIAVTRATCALLSLSAAVAAGLTMKVIFKLPVWWVVVLFLAATPAWFLHSRTGLETVMMVSFYAWFLSFYLLYRYRSPSYLFPALVAGALSFYAYADGQGVVTATAVLLLLSDWRYHARHLDTLRVGFLLLILLAWPYLRFRLQHPGALGYQFYLLNSYWLLPISLTEKLQRYAGTYLYGLSPQYWFFPNSHGLIRHQMKGYGNVATWQLPFVVVGAAVCLRRFRSSMHRTLLIAAVASPVASATVDIGITRVLSFVVPAAMLATVGFQTVLSLCRSPRLELFVAAVWSAVLAYAALAMFGAALADGPTWYQDYGLYGMQWGAKQLLQEAVPAYLRSHPGDPVYVTPNWANGTDTLLTFFDLPFPQVQTASIDGWVSQKQPLPAGTEFVMMPDELQEAQSSGKFTGIRVDRVILHPDGTPGFYFVHLAYARGVDTIFAAQRRAELKPVRDQITLEGETVGVVHTRFDMGDVGAMFDGNLYTLARGIDVNPLLLDFRFPAPRRMSGLDGYFGNVDYRLSAVLYGPGSSQGSAYSRTFRYGANPLDLPAGRQARLSFAKGPARVVRLRLEVLYLGGGPQAHVHVFEVHFR
jgi:hypothetical protein